MIAAGFVCASMLAGRMARQRGIDPEKLTNLALICFIAGIIGARLYFVALSWQSFLDRPQDILATWQGGLSIHGGIIGGALAGFLYAHLTGLPKRRVADICGTVVPLGQAIGRWGNFFNSEAFGAPVPEGFPLAVFIPRPSRPEMYETYSLFHATFLYECVWDLSIFFFLYFVISKKLAHIPGLCFLLYIALYSIGRLLIEPLRTDSIMANQIPIPMLASALFLVVSLGLIPHFVALAKKEHTRPDV